MDHKHSQALKKYYEEEMLPTEYVLFDMELRGNYIDKNKLHKAIRELTYLKTHKRNDLYALCMGPINTIRRETQAKERAKFKTAARKARVPLPEFNWNSPIQKCKLFYDHLGLSEYCHDVTETGQPSLSKKHLVPVLDRMESGVSPVHLILRDSLKLYLKLQVYDKMLSTYALGILERMVGDKIHGEYYQVSREDAYKDEGGTVTGRLSHRNPNLGNLPRTTDDYWAGAFVKDLFIPPQGQVFVTADYSQIELRVAAHLSHDEPFREAFMAGADPHQQTANDLEVQGLEITRHQAKTINFLMIYMGSPWRLCHELGKNPDNPQDYALCESIIDKFFIAHPRLYEWIMEQRRYVKRHGFVTSMFNLRRNLPDVWHWDKKTRRHALKQAGNFVVQSAAASICKRAMIKLHDQGFKIVNQVHDSITCAVDENLAEQELELLKTSMIRTGEEVGLSIPLDVDGKIIKTFKE